MMAGRKVLEALIIYCKIDVQQSLREITLKSSKRKEQDGSNTSQQYEETKFDSSPFLALNVDSL